MPFKLHFLVLPLIALGCAGKTNPFENHGAIVEVLATGPQPWSVLLKSAPEIERFHGNSISYRYKAQDGRELVVGTENGHVDMLVMIDGPPNDDGKCTGAFRNRKDLSEAIAAMLNSSGQKVSAERVLDQIDSGLDKGLQLPVFDLKPYSVRSLGCDELPNCDQPRAELGYRRLFVL